MSGEAGWLSSKHTRVHGCQLCFRGWSVAGEPGVPRESDANHETWQQFHRDTRTMMNCKICTYCILTKKEQKQTKKNWELWLLMSGNQTLHYYFFFKWRFFSQHSDNTTIQKKPQVPEAYNLFYLCFKIFLFFGVFILVWVFFFF